MEVNRQSSMLSTNEFIKRKCSKDHLSSSKNSPTKHSSMYASDYKQKLLLKNMEPNISIAKQRNSPIKVQNNHINSLSSVYRNSFQKSQYVAPKRFHQKPSFFLKNDNYQPPQSTYNKSQIHKQNIKLSEIERGKAKMDNLSVAKYNRMTTNSLYHDTYLDYTKLPIIKQPKLIKQSSNIRFSWQGQSNMGFKK